jgi:hypothetical protein
MLSDQAASDRSVEQAKSGTLTAVNTNAWLIEKEARVNLGCIRFGYSPRLVSPTMLEIVCN